MLACKNRPVKQEGHEDVYVYC